jgi:WD40 repeat protein
MPYTIAWSPSGDRIQATYDDNTARVWDAINGEPLLTFTGHDSEVQGASWSPDGSQIATGDTSGKVIVWDSAIGKEILTFSGHEQGGILRAKWSPDGSRVMSTSNEGEAIIWEAATGQVLLELFREDFKFAVSDAAWTKDGQRVIVFSADGFVRTFDSRTGEQLSQFLTPSGSSITFFSISPTEERIIIGGHDGMATVWDIATGVEVLNYEVGGFVDPAYSPDGTRVLIGNTEGDWGKLQVFPVWHSLEELIDYAKECCVVRELTPGEREKFGLKPR